MLMKKNISFNKIPNHVAIIMDGNGRWAKKRGKLRIKGHKAGALAIQKAVEFAIKNNIHSLTLYAFSKENWNRPHNEVKSLMKLFYTFLKRTIKNINIYNIKLTIIGDIKQFTPKLKKYIKNAVSLTKYNTGLQLNIAANYSGRWDIIHVIKIIAKKVKIGILSPENINEKTVNQSISLHDQPKIDLVIRTGKEKRISNFLLWQIAYSELYFTDVLWPDFNEHTFKNAILNFNKRNRRFGNIKNEKKKIKKILL